MKSNRIQRYLRNNRMPNAQKAWWIMKTKNSNGRYIGNKWPVNARPLPLNANRNHGNVIHLANAMAWAGNPSGGGNRRMINANLLNMRPYNTEEFKQRVKERSNSKGGYFSRGVARGAVKAAVLGGVLFGLSKTPQGRAFINKAKNQIKRFLASKNKNVPANTAQNLQRLGPNGVRELFESGQLGNINFRNQTIRNQFKVLENASKLQASVIAGVAGAATTTTIAPTVISTALRQIRSSNQLRQIQNSVIRRLGTGKFNPEILGGPIIRADSKRKAINDIINVTAQAITNKLPLRNQNQKNQVLKLLKGAVKSQNYLTAKPAQIKELPTTIATKMITNFSSASQPKRVGGGYSVPVTEAAQRAGQLKANQRRAART